MWSWKNRNVSKSKDDDAMLVRTCDVEFRQICPVCKNEVKSSLHFSEDENKSFHAKDEVETDFVGCGKCHCVVEVFRVRRVYMMKTFVWDSTQSLGVRLLKSETVSEENFMLE